MKKKFRHFKEAREFVHALNLNSIKEWKEYCKSGKKPDDIPSYPNEHYKDKGWSTWGDWLRAGRKPERETIFVSFEQAREFVRLLNLKNNKEWRKYCNSGRKPRNIPSNPESVYKNKDWKGWGDWLGTDRIATHLRKYRTFEDAREFARSQGLKSANEWRKFSTVRSMMLINSASFQQFPETFLKIRIPSMENLIIRYNF